MVGLSKVFKWKTIYLELKVRNGLHLCNLYFFEYIVNQCQILSLRRDRLLIKILNNGIRNLRIFLGTHCIYMLSLPCHSSRILVYKGNSNFRSIRSHCKTILSTACIGPYWSLYPNSLFFNIFSPKENYVNPLDFQLLTYLITGK